jgi:hypothetical protein
MTDDEYEAESIRRALAGDAEAGDEVLRMCRTGLDNGKLSAELAYYLAERITDLLSGIPPDRALCIAPERGRGQPKNPFPDWKNDLGAFAAVLSQRGYAPQRIAEAMCDVRRTKYDKPLDESDAHKIRKTYEPMQRMGIDDLMRFVGPYGKELKDYPPVE